MKMDSPMYDVMPVDMKGVVNMMWMFGLNEAMNRLTETN